MKFDGKMRNGLLLLGGMLVVCVVQASGDACGYQGSLVPAVDVIYQADTLEHVKLKNIIDLVKKRINEAKGLSHQEDAVYASTAEELIEVLKKAQGYQRGVSSLASRILNALEVAVRQSLSQLSRSSAKNFWNPVNHVLSKFDESELRIIQHEIDRLQSEIDELQENLIDYQDTVFYEALVHLRHLIRDKQYKIKRLKKIGEKLTTA